MRTQRMLAALLTACALCLLLGTLPAAAGGKPTTTPTAPASALPWSLQPSPAEDPSSMTLAPDALTKTLAGGLGGAVNASAIPRECMDPWGDGDSCFCVVTPDGHGCGGDLGSCSSPFYNPCKKPPRQ